MKAIILAAGASTRCFPLTISTPKPLLKVANKTIIEHNIEQLKGIAQEIIIIVSYKKEMIVNCLKNFKEKMSFVEQGDPLGTGHALLKAEQYISNNIGHNSKINKTSENNKFIVLMGDNIYHKEDIKACLKYENSMLVCAVENPEQFGIVELDNNILKNISEKPKNPKSNLANAGLYVFTPEVFTNLKKIKKSPRGEIELTDALSSMKINCIKAKRCIFITFPWDLLDANEALLKEIKKSEISGEIEKGATIKGIIKIGKGTVLKSGAYIEGPVVIGDKCTIGPNCYIRPHSSIGNNCKVGNGCEIKNTILFDNTSVGHLSYIGDSVLGEKVNIGAGTITANLRHDDKTIKTIIKQELLDTKRRKLGTIIGNNAHTGIHTTIYPGRKISYGKSTLPGQIVKEDI